MLSSDEESDGETNLLMVFTPLGLPFVNTVRNPADEKYKRFAKEQEAARKNMEQVFGVL
jgi:hypothetical protein